MNSTNPNLNPNPDQANFVFDQLMKKGFSLNLNPPTSMVSVLDK